MQWANRKTFSILTPIMGVGLLIPYIAGMMAGRTHHVVIYSGLVTGWFFSLCLLMTPLYIIWGIRGGQSFKRPFGVLAFVYSLLHGFAYLMDKQYDFAALVENDLVITGVLAVLIMLPLALTSTNWAMRKMGKNWKRMQRLTYVAALLIVAHIFMAHSKSGIVILVLLVVRIPLLRRFLIQRHTRSRRQALGSH